MSRDLQDLIEALSIVGPNSVFVCIRKPFIVRMSNKHAALFRFYQYISSDHQYLNTSSIENYDYDIKNRITIIMQ